MLPYGAALAFLLDRNPLRVKLGLERIELALRLLGNPHFKIPAIHVAGTNGKGSVCTYLAQLLGYLGYPKTGLYTSPHLQSFRERIQINGQPISRVAVARWVHSHKNLILELNLSYFEVVTLMAFCHFNDEKCDVMVVETGLGGRLDATNVLRPELTCITNIGLEHEKTLGPGITAILKEKAGILKPGVPLVTQPLPPELFQVLKRELVQKSGGPLIQSSPASLRSEPSGHYWRASNGPLRLDTGHTLLFQKQNLAQALTAANWWASHHHRSWQSRNLHLQPPPARAQWIQPKQGAPILLDVCHNMQGFQKLAHYLKKEHHSKRIHFFCTLMPDKDPEPILTLLEKTGCAFHWVHLWFHPRYNYTPGFTWLGERFSPWKQIGTDPGRGEAGLWEEFGEIYSGLHPDSDLAVVCGSFYLAGSFKKTFNSKKTIG